MGRMFEALKQADAQSDAVEEERVALLREHAPAATDSAGDEEDDSLELTSDAPFIEVGPNKSMEASPGLLDRPPVAPSRMAPRLAVEEPVRATLPEEQAAPPVLPMTISFRSPDPATVERPASRPSLAPELIAYHCPEHPTSVRYEEILSTLTASTASGRAPAFFFTSALFGAGTTTVLLNLAITGARQGKCRVVVVDANLRRPGLASHLRIADEPGLREVLNGAAKLEDAIQETAQINLFALTTGTRHTDGGPRLVAGTMRSLVRDLRRTFDLVLVDGPRWDGRPDVVAAGVACDAVYVVMPEAEAESPQMDQLFQIIPEQGAKLGGCVLAAFAA